MGGYEGVCVHTWACMCLCLSIGCGRRQCSKLEWTQGSRKLQNNCKEISLVRVNGPLKTTTTRTLEFKSGTSGYGIRCVQELGGWIGAPGSSSGRQELALPSETERLYTQSLVVFTRTISFRVCLPLGVLFSWSWYHLWPVPSWGRRGWRDTHSWSLTFAPTLICCCGWFLPL